MNDTAYSFSRRPRPTRPVLLSLMAALVLVSGNSLAAGEAGTPACCAKTAAAGDSRPLPDRSLYQLGASWTNDSGTALTMASLKGRPQIVTMFFARCEFTCPLLVHDMKRVEAALPAEVRTNVGFVLVTLDTERDTPAALRDYRRIQKLPENWTLLRGSPDDVLELAALLGVKFAKDARGGFAHSNIITVLDAGGEVIHQQIGLNQETGETVRRIVQAAGAANHSRDDHE